MGGRFCGRRAGTKLKVETSLSVQVELQSSSGWISVAIYDSKAFFRAMKHSHACDAWMERALQPTKAPQRKPSSGIALQMPIGLHQIHYI